MHTNGKIIKSISTTETKIWRKLLSLCMSETNAFIKTGSDYSGYWVVKVTVNPKIGIATFSHQLTETSSLTSNSRKEYDKAMEEAKAVFAKLGEEVPAE